MIKKTIKYEDFRGNERSEDYYFHMSKSEIYKWQNSVNGGLDVVLGRIINEMDQAKLIEYFQEIIEKSYGKLSDDGKRFEKSPEILQEFTSSAAYDALYMELVSNTDKAIEFCNGIVPKDLAKAISDKNPKITAIESFQPVV